MEPSPRQPLQNVVNFIRSNHKKSTASKRAAKKKKAEVKIKSNSIRKLPISTKIPEPCSVHSAPDTVQSLPPKKVVNDCSDSDIPVRTWLTLPMSQYGVRYDVGSATTSTCLYDADGNRNNMILLHLVSKQTPFERRMQELKRVLETKYPNGASLVYVREFMEPTDAEFRSMSSLPSVQLQSLSSEQVDRLQVIIVDQNRMEVLVPYLGFYQHLPYNMVSHVVDHFETFKTTYTKIRNYKVKFNVIFCFTFALYKFDVWMRRPERGVGRQKMVEGLALRWRNLLSNHTTEQLDLDEEFSLPAVKSLLNLFKIKVENAPTFGDPKMNFNFE